MEEFIYENIKRLETPVGYFSITDEGREMPFSVKENAYSVNIYGENGEVLKEVFADTCYAVVIKTADYKIGKTYKYSFSSVLEEIDGDEPQHSRYGIIGNCAVGIGMNNPNEWDELEQCYKYSKKTGAENELIEPPFYDETGFQLYSMRYSEDGKGFYFKLLDRSRKEICFEAAWMTAGKYSIEDCEDAVDFWVS
ncbi:MAG: hypothetical protein E7489_06825 [Ruminococcaceae bacterium]|nr:hypothetical protein [Oscillospiraceae bacterium]